MKKQLISFDSPPDPITYCEAIDCDFLDGDKCLVGREERECAEENEARGEKIRELIREEKE